MLSVIIPCYNGEKYVARAIESIYMQKCEKIELIVVDDGSVDQSKEIILSWVSKFEQKDWELKYLWQENSGVGAAVNSGLKLITGKYLLLLDADDRLLDGAVDKMIYVLDNNPHITCVRTNGWVINETDRWLFTQDCKEKQEEDVFENILLGKTHNWAGSYMVRTKELFEVYYDRNIHPSRYGQNLQILLPCVYNKKTYYLNEPLMEYIRQKDSLSSICDKNQRLQRGIKNAKEYANIRKNIIEKLVEDEKQKVLYVEMIQKGYLELLFQLACIYKEKELLKNVYKSLKKMGAISLQQKIQFYQVTSPVFALVLRVLRKVGVLSKSQK